MELFSTVIIEKTRQTTNAKLAIAFVNLKAFRFLFVIQSRPHY